MSISPTKSSLSDEELDSFLVELGLLQKEDREPEALETFDQLLAQILLKKNKEQPSQSIPSQFNLKKKATLFSKWGWLWIPFFLSLGFVSGWLLKPIPHPPRTKEAIGEEIVLLLKELKQIYLPAPLSAPIPAEPTELHESQPDSLQPGTSDEIIEPLNPLDDFSVA